MEGLTYYLNPEALEATLQTVATQLAKGSAVAFDYVGRHIIESNGPLFYRLLVPMIRLTSYSWVFGISTDSPTEEKLTAFLDENGLKLAEYEPIGNADRKQRLIGGLVLATNGQIGDQPSP